MPEELKSVENGDKEGPSTLDDELRAIAQENGQDGEVTASAERAEETSANLKRGIENIPENEEFVETFIDSQGTLREPSQPIVLLDKEARQAIDDFFVEHHAYADTIETTIDMAAELRGIPGIAEPISTWEFIKVKPGTDKIFATIQSPKAIELRVNAAIDNPAGQPVEDQSAETEGVAPTPLQEMTTFMEVTSGDLPDGSSFAQIMKYLVRLPPDARGSLEVINLSKLKMRLSSNARNEAIGQINEHIADIRKTKSIEIQTLLVASLTSSLTDSIRDTISADPSRESGDDETGSSRLIPDDSWQIGIDRHHTPVQNETLLSEFNENLSAVLQDLRSMGSAEDSALETLTSRDALAAIQQLSPDDQKNLFKEVAGEADNLLRSDEIKPQVPRLQQAHRSGRLIDSHISREIKSAIETVFIERALPTYYVSDKEKSRLKDLIGKYNDFIPDADPRGKLDSAEQERRMLNVYSVTVVSASQMICHATSYVAEILESGAIRTKQRQLDNGVLHEQTDTASHSNSDPTKLSTYTSVPHFSKGYAGYLNLNESSTSGIFLVPMSDIVAVAPYDSEGRLLRVLPSAPGSKSVGVANITKPYIQNDILEDQVFYSSPVYDESDDYEIPLDNSLLVIVQIGDREIRIPKESNIPVKIVHRDREHAHEDHGEIGSAIRGLIEEHQPTQPESVVIPLRAGGLEFIPENPQGLRHSRIRKSEVGRVLDTRGRQIVRKHTDNLKRV